MSLISVKNLTIKYENHTLLNKLSFDVKTGDFLCVVGSNGSGKSTLLKAILGLIDISGGEIIFGENLNRNQLGYMPQESKINLNFPATVAEIVSSGLLNQKLTREKSAEKTKKLLKQLSLDKISTTRFGELSGGQRQRVLLARALAATDKLLILDEPSNNLDQTTRKKLNQLLQELNANGLSIILVTHDLDHDNLLGNKILNLSTGFFGSTEEYYRRLHDR